MDIPTIDDVIEKGIIKEANLRYYSEQLIIKITEIEKLRNEALEIQKKLIECEKINYGGE